MAGKKQGKGLQTPSVNIRSRTSSGFNVLDCLEENFPILHTGKPGNLPASGNALEEPAVVVKQVANFGDLNATPMSAGKQGNGIEKQLNAAGAVLTAGTPAEPATSVKVTSPTAAIQIGGAAVKTKQPPAAQPDLEPNSIAAGKTPGNAGSETTLLPGDKTSSSPTKPADTTAKKASPAMGSSAETSAANPGKATTRTNTQWSELFRDNRAPSKGIKLEYLPSNDDVVDLSNCVLPSMVSLWGYCLVGCFTGRFSGLKAIYELMNKWGVHCTLKSHNKGWVIFKFKNEQDRTKVFTEGPYNIIGRLLFLKMLSEDFTFDDEAFLKVPIWVKFPNLPLNLWNEEAMSLIASKVGVPITTDKVTQEMSN
ncbi:unnamed protein product [Cuscuta europaea]|uniref:DUF4283 domain-containing protein n=1 Tax=Cuscuta europaea TaxID=41803 RepID=A0A9P1E6M1_CUSEU|nr:unnamed protein product [Cuscuta europaea]